MRTKEVYQLDKSGIFIGVETSHESPLEPNVFLIPAGCVEIAPPSFTEKQYAQYIDNKWIVKDIPEPIQEPEVDMPELSPEELELQRQEELIQTEIRAVAIERLKARGAL